MSNRIGKLFSIAMAFGCLGGHAAAQTPGQPLTLPARYAGHRFYVEPVTRSGEKLVFYTDTGGGLFLLDSVARRLGLEITKEGPLELVSLPPFADGQSIPAPEVRGGRIPVYKPERPLEGMNADGMLGQDWFGGRVWTFDYPARKLLLRAAADLPAGGHRISLGFQTDSSGNRALNFPRVQVEIDGDLLDLLLDTGAMTPLTEVARAALGTEAVTATSFITDTVFAAWHARHPDWRVIDSAESTTGQAMIEVPAVTVAGYTVGPVWFTRRANRNFHEFMSRFMDRRVQGALGGNALRHFRLTVDYPAAVAVFEKSGG